MARFWKLTAAEMTAVKMCRVLHGTMEYLLGIGNEVTSLTTGPNSGLSGLHSVIGTILNEPSYSGCRMLDAAPGYGVLPKSSIMPGQCIVQRIAFRFRTCFSSNNL